MSCENLEVNWTLFQIKMAFKKFDTLIQAIQEVDQHPSLALSMFSKEVKQNYRIFLVANKVKENKLKCITWYLYHKADFWAFYKNMKQSERKFYEIIKEDYPCKGMVYYSVFLPL